MRKLILKKKFKDKTKNDWDNRHKFKSYNGKYTLIEIDYGVDAPVEPIEIKNPEKKNAAQSKLDDRVQELVKLIFDLKMMERAMKEMEFDIEKSPLGKLTKKQILKGYEILKEIEDALDAGSHDHLRELSNEFYTLIPHSFGRRVPAVIENVEMMKSKMQMLEALADIEIAAKMLKESDEAGGNPIDSNYEKLETEFRPIDPESQEWEIINKYVENSQEGKQTLELVELFAVDRKGERQRFEESPAIQIGNRRLLWHGSRLTNFVGIISQGLRIAPPEAPVSGYRFGKGLYYADMMSLSSKYCRVTKENPIGCMLLCDVALGKMYEASRDQFMEKPPNGYDSTFALGVVEPDPKGNYEHPDGFMIPAGKIIPNNNKGVACHEHQFISYDARYTNIRYMLKLRWKFNQK